MLIKNNDNLRCQIAYTGGLTKPMLTDIRNTDVAKVQHYFATQNINTDFDGEKFLAWATARVFTILKCINERFRLNIGLPKHILVKDPSKLNIENMERTYGFTNFVPSRIHKDSDEITPALSIIFNKDFPWKQINEISDIDYYVAHNSNTDFFLESIFHEFSHIIHEQHLLNKFGVKQTIKKLSNLTNQDNIINYRTQFGELIENDLCGYAKNEPLDLIGCDMSKRFIENLNRNTLEINNNPHHNSPYERYYALRHIFQEKKPLDSLIRHIYQGKTSAFNI